MEKSEHVYRAYSAYNHCNFKHRYKKLAPVMYKGHRIDVLRYYTFYGGQYQVYIDGNQQMVDAHSTKEDAVSFAKYVINQGPDHYVSFKLIENQENID